MVQRPIWSSKLATSWNSLDYHKESSPEFTNSNLDSLGHAEEVWLRLSSWCTRPGAHVRFFHFGQTADGSQEQWDGGRAVESDPLAMASPSGQYLLEGRAELTVSVWSLKNKTDQKQGEIVRWLTKWHSAWSGSGIGDFLTLSVHTPALADAGVALRGLVGSVLVALRDVVADSRPRSEEGKNARAGGGGGCSGLGALPVPFTCCLFPLWNVFNRVVMKNKASVAKQKLWLAMISITKCKAKVELFLRDVLVTQNVLS